MCEKGEPIWQHYGRTAYHTFSPIKRGVAPTNMPMVYSTHVVLQMLDRGDFSVCDV